MPNSRVVPRRRCTGLLIASILLSCLFGCNRNRPDSVPTKTESNSSKKKELTHEINKSNRSSGQEPKGVASREAKEVRQEYAEHNCRIPTRNGHGAFVQFVIPEGASVDEGEILVKFDSYDWQVTLGEATREINHAETELAKADAELNLSEAAYREFTQGEFVRQKARLENELKKNREALGDIEKRDDLSAFERQVSIGQMYEELRSSSETKLTA